MAAALLGDFSRLPPAERKRLLNVVGTQDLAARG